MFNLNSVKAAGYAALFIGSIVAVYLIHEVMVYLVNIHVIPWGGR